MEEKEEFYEEVEDYKKNMKDRSKIKVCEYIKAEKLEHMNLREVEMEADEYINRKKWRQI